MTELPIRPEALNAALTAALDFAPENDEGPGAMRAAIVAFCEAEGLRVETKDPVCGDKSERLVGPWREVKDD
jgi:hypothetical protein